MGGLWLSPSNSVHCATLFNRLNEMLSACLQKKSPSVSQSSIRQVEEVEESQRTVPTRADGLLWCPSHTGPHKEP